MDEFDRVFSELFFSPHKRMSHLATDLVLDENCGGSSQSGNSRTSKLQSIHEKEDSITQDGAKKTEQTSVKKSEHKPLSWLDSKLSKSSVSDRTGICQGPSGSPVTAERHQFASSPISSRAKVHKAKRSSLHEDMLHSYETDSQSVQEARSDLYMSSLRKLKSSLWDKNDKLFADLLDDLDSISKLDTESARKRKKARDLFSDWLFSHDEKVYSQKASPDTRYFQRTPSGSRLRPQKSRHASKTKRSSADLSDLSTAWSDMMVKNGRRTDQKEVGFLF